ncbi:UNC-like C-terminal-domain-containing protein [Cadophora sp. MPI-SDFR-AT-0126]|nr:UNC-like C-terminal-domain-containing protein [Leotiomycetes sp. MPI-SDFR-AT-0126]
MRLSGQHFRIVSIAATLPLLLSANASTITTAPKPTALTSSNTAATGTCEFRTINYITDTLPQQCLKSSWSSANGTAVKAVEGGEATTTHAEAQGGGNGNGTATAGGDAASSPTNNQDAPQSTNTGESTPGGGDLTAASPASETAGATATDLDTGELSESSFLSFEEWKKQTLEKAGQANANIGGKKSGDGKKRDSESFQNNLDSLGEEGEIDLDFAAFRSGGKEEKGKGNGGEEERETEGQDVQEVEGGERKDQYRSKDAGKTCKERANYASFDAGATILKTHHGAKNNKAVLIENKDSYMLSECTIENKFVIIELSEDIWIDTVVLANYEFFSSMVRTFRVSVSDRYPVKMDKWKDIGTYEARNSREIQAFLITNPQIWTRYIRIEFLSHYGNEYYCPLSLVRVHGTRMLESWKESEASGDDDELEEIDAGPDEQFIPDAVAEVVQIAEQLKAASDEMARTAEASEPSVPFQNSTQTEATNSTEKFLTETTPWENSGAYIFRFPSSVPDEVCLPSESPIQVIQTVTICTGENSTQTVQPSTQSPVPASDTPTTIIESTTTHTINSIMSNDSTFKDSLTAATTNTTISTSDIPISSPPTASTTHKIHNSTHHKNKTSSTTSASSSLPTIQESFFKAVSRRLNFLETNSTLSLKYIEEQSRILREAFTKVEKKQLQKTTTFLDTLNSTVLDELRQFRQQYDEIWQSTVISLESQRDESRREILAISSRLNILADEVVFQKRMSIVQSVLLLLCLALVIFSRVSGGTNIDFPTLHSRARLLSGFPIESPLESPGENSEYRRANGRPWQDSGDQRLHFDDDAEAPPTPVSAYSRSEDVNSTPPSGGDDLDGGNTGYFLSAAEEPENYESGPSSRNITPVKPVPPNTTYSSPQSTHLEPTTPKTRTPKKRKGFVRQRSASMEDEVFSSPNENGSAPKLSMNGMSPPVISVQDATPIRRQRSISPSPSPTPDKGGMRVTTTEVSDSFDGDEESGENSMRQDNSSHLPSPPPDYFPTETETRQQNQRARTDADTDTDTNPSTATATTPFATSPPAPASPTRERKQSFSIARKPLPALPPDA